MKHIDFESYKRVLQRVCRVPLKFYIWKLYLTFVCLIFTRMWRYEWNNSYSLFNFDYIFENFSLFKTRTSVEILTNKILKLKTFLFFEYHIFHRLFRCKIYPNLKVMVNATIFSRVDSMWVFRWKNSMQKIRNYEKLSLYSLYTKLFWGF